MAIAMRLLLLALVPTLTAGFVMPAPLSTRSAVRAATVRMDEPAEGAAPVVPPKYDDEERLGDAPAKPAGYDTNSAMAAPAGIAAIALIGLASYFGIIPN